MVRLLLGSLLAAACTAKNPDPPAPPVTAASNTPAPAPAPAPSSTPAPAPAPAGTGTEAEALPADLIDLCPDAPETVNGYEDADGCPDEVPAEVTAITGIVDGISFRPNSAELELKKSRPALDRLVDVLLRHSAVTLEIAVHSDESTSKGCLTCRRADAIARYLLAKDVGWTQLLARGYGAQRPLGDDPRKNRRIELTLQVPTATPATPPSLGPAECLDRKTVRQADGALADCYPYVCRAGACLTRCDERTDCAGAQTLGEMSEQGWPLECMPSGECTPMHPDKVH
ncbi:OmpA family protein [Nannocystis punicea]|uniref:OmpA family protein n=1 Tax=Nannocystis punicea TaxID=2995304 RepID=A0ABY7HDX9_9BACT|nr:OmpA family protein [Nannocystis poenicansa]WAS97179.1 OmpA family protein [Nannocystis poenicansa]